MTASAENIPVNEQPTAPAAAAKSYAGFSSRPQTPHADDEADEAAKIAAPAAAPDADPKSKLNADFQGTDFMRLLCMIYGIQEIPTAIAPVLNDFKLDNSKEKPASSNDTLYAKFGDVSIEITKDSILADETAGPMTPELAYKMAAAASLNPSYQTLSLSGSMEDRAMLFLAAKHFDLKIEKASMPQVYEDVMGPLAEKFHAFEKSAGLTKSAAARYLPSKQEVPAARATNKQERAEPTGMPNFALN